MTMKMVKLSHNSKLVPDPGLVLQKPLWNGAFPLEIPCIDLQPMTRLHKI